MRQLQKPRQKSKILAQFEKAEFLELADASCQHPQHGIHVLRNLSQNASAIDFCRHLFKHTISKAQISILKVSVFLIAYSPQNGIIYSFCPEFSAGVTGRKTGSHTKAVSLPSRLDCYRFKIATGICARRAPILPFFYRFSQTPDRMYGRRPTPRGERAPAAPG